MSKKTKKTNVSIGNRCFICGQQYGRKVVDMHMHSYFHHEAIEKIKGSEQLHTCWACDVSVMGLEQYKEHIDTRKHKQNLFKLHSKRLKRRPVQVDYNIDLTDNELKALSDLRQQERREQKNLVKCSICFHHFPEQEWDKHMHSIVHHQAVEQLKGSEQEHKCWACEMSVTGMAAFKKHIDTQYHKMKLLELMKNRNLGKNTVDYSVEFNELKDLCAQRNQEKREQKNLVKCSICLHRFPEQEWDKHMHSIVHHQAVEQLKGSEQEHKCWACEMSVTGMAAFKKHINTQYHKMKLLELMKNRNLGKNTVDYSVELNELKDLCAQRNQEKRKQKILDKCSICFHRFPEQEWDKHMHSIVHHQAVEQLKGSEQRHNCWACEMSVMGMAAFKKHIDTQYHKMKLLELTKNRNLGKNTVDYSVEFNELKDLCAQRNQEKFMKKKEKIEKWKEAKRQKTMRLIQTENTAENERCTIPFMANEEFTADQLSSSWHLFSFWENQNDHPESIQHNQNLPTQRQESILDMDRSNGPLVKRPRLERPSEYVPQEMSARGTHPNPDGNGTDVHVNDMTPETEDGTAAEPTCGPGLVQSRMEANKPNLTATRGVCLTRKATTGNEAVVFNPPLQKHTRSKKSVLKVNRVASQSEQGMTREGLSGQEPHVDSLLPVSSMAEMFESHTSENDLEIVGNTVHAEKNKSNECVTEQGETSLEHHNSFEAISCKVQKTKKKKQNVSHNLNPETNKISRKKKVNKLISLSLKEEELTSSLENVGEQLFQAYSTLQSAYTEVQHLLAVKQEVTTEMASLRARRIKILQNMKNPGDQQEVLNAS